MLINMILPGAVEVVPPDENTLLLLHGEDLTDGSMYGQTVTNNGVSVSTEQSKFGGKSLYFNGSSYLNIPISVSGDFTIDFWCYIQQRLSGKTWVCPVHLTNNGARGVLTYLVDTITYLCVSSSSVTMGEVIATGAWHHYAIVQNGNTVKLYIDGVQKLSVAGSVSGTNLAVGYDSLSPNDTMLCGYMDEIRVSNVARWTKNFTPPTEPYNPGTGTVGGSDITYTGNYTDNRINGKGKVRLNTSGTLTVLSGSAKVSVYILAGGGGAATHRNNSSGSSSPIHATGGGGGNQTVEVELAPGTYDIVIGSGGSPSKMDSYVTTTAQGGNGGDTIAFGVTSTGGGGGSVTYGSSTFVGTGGTPNGGNGNTGEGSYISVSGGSPNGGAIIGNNSVPSAPQPGGDGYVELTFI